MGTFKGLVAAVVLGGLAVVGCGAPASSEGDSEEAEGAVAAASMTSPEALAAWLRKPDAIKYLGQFRDTRESSLFPSSLLTCKEWGHVGCTEEGTLLADITTGAADDPKIQAIVAHGKKAHRAFGDTVLMKAPTFVAHPDLAAGCIEKPGIFVYAAGTEHLSVARDLNQWVGWHASKGGYADEEAPRVMHQLADAKVDVSIVLPPAEGEDFAAEQPVMHLTFGVVERALRPGGPTGKYWTILGATRQQRCSYGDESFDASDEETGEKVPN